ncbi:hypothetical protein ACJRO7_007721 [Eucalyptus globulus]|uniref:Uncharacterized protein n=1 Tax=Eucalyptus globulus TaxID=34317 RepID=A0ABD3INW7_EUCGL
MALSSDDGAPFLSLRCHPILSFLLLSLCPHFRVLTPSWTNIISSQLRATGDGQVAGAVVVRREDSSYWLQEWRRGNRRSKARQSFAASTAVLAVAGAVVASG